MASATKPPHLFAQGTNPKFAAFVSQNAGVITVGEGIHRWQFSDGKLLVETAGSGDPTAFAISEDRSLFAVATNESVEIRDPVTLKILHIANTDSPANSVTISFDNKYLAVREDSGATVFRIADMLEVEKFDCEWQIFGYDIQFLPDGKLASTLSNEIELVEIPQGGTREKLALDVHNLPFCKKLAYRKGRLFGLREFDIYEFEATTRKLVRRIDSQFSAEVITPLPDKDILILGNNMGWIDVNDLASGKRVRRLKGHMHSINSLDLSSDDEWLVSVDTGGDVRVWNLESAIADPSAYNLSGGEHASHDYPNAAGMKFGIDSRTLTSARTGAIHLWSLPDCTLLKGIPILKGEKRVQFLPDGEAFSVLWIDRAGATAFRAVLYDLDSGLQLHDTDFPIPYPAFATINPGKTLVAAFGDDCLNIVKFPSGEVIQQIEAHSGPIEDSRFSGLVFSNDGQTLVSSGRDCTLCEWEATTGKLIRSYQGKGKSIESFQVSHDGSCLVVSESHAIMVLDAVTWAVLKKIPQKQRIHWSSLAISSDNALLAFTSTHYKEIKIFSLQSGKQIDTLLGHTSGITGVCFSPDDAYLASTSDDETLKIWKNPQLKHRS